jgi:hypothetical protein
MVVRLPIDQPGIEVGPVRAPVCRVRRYARDVVRGPGGQPCAAGQGRVQRLRGAGASARPVRQLVRPVELRQLLARLRLHGQSGAEREGEGGRDRDPRRQAGHARPPAETHTARVGSSSAAVGRHRMAVRVVSVTRSLRPKMIWRVLLRLLFPTTRTGVRACYWCMDGRNVFIREAQPSDARDVGELLTQLGIRSTPLRQQRGWPEGMKLCSWQTRSDSWKGCFPPGDNCPSGERGQKRASRPWW